MSAEEKEGRARNEEIENQLRRDRMMQRNEIKMLLLGTLLDSLPVEGGPGTLETQSGKKTCKPPDANKEPP
jgi:hypothetical protein